VFFMLVARRFVVSGRVQGVGFRYFAQDMALREGATGWIRNLPDGRVEALVEGDAEAVTRFERALRSGPRGARVETVTVDVEDVSGAYDSFSVTS
jgi:acylphosphatase